MMAGSHVAVGLVAWAWIGPRLGLGHTAPGLMLAAAGSLLPDIDHPQSWVGRRARTVSRALASVVSHRGVTHSLVAVVLCGVLVRADRTWGTPLAAGYLSHLAADLLTPGGLRLLWPLRRRWALPLCRTGSPVEPLLVGALVLWTGWRLLGHG